MIWAFQGVSETRLLLPYLEIDAPKGTAFEVVWSDVFDPRLDPVTMEVPLWTSGGQKVEA